jgi:dTMP kinase
VFITFEGIGGAGKTTQAKRLADSLVSFGLSVVVTREPGGTTVGESLRHVLLSGSGHLTPRAETALFAASRAQLVDEVVRPALAKGAWVISDRFIDSSLVYQGVVKGVGVESVLSMNSIATDGIEPDVTFLLLIDPEAASRRRLKTDKVEPQDRAKRLQLDQAYRDLARRFPERIVEIDATRSVQDVSEFIRDQIRMREPLLP